MTTITYYLNKTTICCTLLMALYLPCSTNAPLTFTSANDVLIAYNNHIYGCNVTTQEPTIRYKFAKRTILEDIAYNPTDETIWTTTRHGMADSGTYNNLFILSSETGSTTAYWSSEHYWPTWNNCAQIFLAPNGNRFMIKKTHYTTGNPCLEPHSGGIYHQQFAILPENLNPKEEIPCALTGQDPLDLRWAEISDDADISLISTYRGKIFLWNPTTQKICPVEIPSREYLHFGSLSSNGQWAFVATSDHGFLCAIDKQSTSFKIIKALGHDTDIDFFEHCDLATFSADASHLIIVAHQSEAYKNPTKFHLLVFNVTTQKLESHLAYHFTDDLKKEEPAETIKELLTEDFRFEQPFQACALSPDGKTIATLSNRGVLRLIDTENKKACVLPLR